MSVTRTRSPYSPDGFGKKIKFYTSRGAVRPGIIRAAGHRPIALRTRHRTGHFKVNSIGKYRSHFYMRDRMRLDLSLLDGPYEIVNSPLGGMLMRQHANSWRPFLYDLDAQLAFAARMCAAMNHRRCRGRDATTWPIVFQNVRSADPLPRPFSASFNRFFKLRACQRDLTAHSSDSGVGAVRQHRDM